MNIVVGQPPNYQQIKQYLNPDNSMVFAYGDTIYAPVKELPADLIKHEQIHQKQQGGNPEAWWTKYCLDKTFRLDQEVEAYGEQLAFIKRNLSTKIAKMALFDFAKSLETLYNIGISYSQAETLINNKSKQCH